MIEDAVDELAIRSDAGVVDIVDVIADDRVAPLMGACAVTCAARAATAEAAR